MTVALLSLFALASLVVFFRAGSRGYQSLVYAAKPLTLVSIGMIAVVAWPPVSAEYQWWIVGGLALSLLGDVLLMLPADRFLAGLSAFFLAHLAYIAAFLERAGAPSPLAFMPYALALVFVARLLWSSLGSLRVPVLAYGLVLGVMAGLALGSAVETGTFSSWMAALGATLFVLSDTALAFNRFLGELDPRGYFILGTYFSAQWLIALSVFA